MSARRLTPSFAGDALTSARLAPVVNGLDGQPVDLDFLDSPEVLRAVVLLAQVALSGSYFDEALEKMAEQSLVAVNAASLAISRWERGRGVLRTLINVGELGPGEQRWPDDEVYPLASHRYAADLLGHGRPYVHSVDDADSEPASKRILQQLGKESQIGVPILCQGAVWGELWASGTDGRRFGGHDVRLLSAVATIASIAIGRAELFSEVARFAYEDPLTGLANRRRVDETLAELDDLRTPAMVMIGDVDGLKLVNDRLGHPAGDALLRGVAGTLDEVATAVDALLVARLGGDEFCVILPGGALRDAERFAALAGRRIAARCGSQVSLCWGAAARVESYPSGRQLMVAADSALLTAKRIGSGRLRLHDPQRDDHTDLAGRRGWPPARRGVDTDVVPRVLDVLDQLQPSTTPEALQIMATECSRLFSAAAWTVWGITPDRRSLQSLSGIDSRHASDSGLWVISPTREIVYAADHFVAAAAAVHTGGTYVASTTLSHTDVADRELLHKLGCQTVLGVGVPDQPLGYLVRLYFESERADLDVIAPIIRVLAHHCACRSCHRTRWG